MNDTPDTKRLIEKTHAITAAADDEPEAETQRDAMLKITKQGGRAFRNNVAEGWIGKSKVIDSFGVAKFEKGGSLKLYPGDVVIRDARRLHSGLIKGSGDLIGWAPLLITEQHLGQTVAVFASWEIKTRVGKLTVEQNAWQRAIKLAGGIGMVVTQDTSEDDLVKWDGPTGVGF